MWNRLTPDARAVLPSRTAPALATAAADTSPNSAGPSQVNPATAVLTAHDLDPGHLADRLAATR